MPDLDRRARLLHPLSAGELVEAIGAEAEVAFVNSSTSVRWDHPHECNPIVGRVVAIIPISPQIFDSLFNGRSGYRAQYYLSLTDGLRFNRALVDRVSPAMLRAFVQRGLPVEGSIARASIDGAYSKVWIADDCAEFNLAPAGEIKPKRWVDACQGALSNMPFRAPLPTRPAIDVKGTWVYPTDGLPWADPLKVDRDEWLHKRGSA